MKKEEKLPPNAFTLEDQEFLKSIGISAMPRGVERLLREQKAGKEAMARIQKRAEGLESLDLDDKTLHQLALEKNRPVSELRDNLQFFRDLEKNVSADDEQGD